MAKSLHILSPPAQLREQAFWLPPSKSLLNRRLVLHALQSDTPPTLPPDLPEDTEILSRMLWHTGPEWHAGAGGTTFRFLASFLAIRGAHGIITGTPGLCRRPVGPLVDALRQLGVVVEYAGLEGYPPLRLNGFHSQKTAFISVDVSKSSQFLTALLLIAPALPTGLDVRLTGTPVSRPYIDMTLRLLREQGVTCTESPGVIRIEPGLPKVQPLTWEADWTAASYAYGLLALYPSGSSLILPGLHRSGYQGDEALVDIMTQFGIDTELIPDGIRIVRTRDNYPSSLEIDLNDHPDIAQTLAVLCGLLGIPAIFHGLSTLAIKETDRTQALSIELEKGKVEFRPIKDKTGSSWKLAGCWQIPHAPIGTWEDHRMAMAFSLTACRGPLTLEDGSVVRKSFPGYWKCLKILGFTMDGPF